jgi:DNA-binding MarR family transcriptional regulator
MERQTMLADADLTAKLRESISPALPYGASLIALDILVAVTRASNAKTPLSVKQLLATLPYSVTGVRYNLSQLVADGWLIKSRRADDRRLVRLFPTERVAEAFAEVRRECESQLRVPPD